MQAQKKEAQSPGKTGPNPGGKQAQTQTKRAMAPNFTDMAHTSIEAHQTEY